MVMLAKQYDYVIGSDPDRDTIDLAVLDTATGGARAHLADSTDAAGYSRMLAWSEQHAPAQRVWALEGTGRFAAGLATFLAEAGEQVVEIGGVKRAQELRTTGSTRCARPARPCPASSKPARVLAACVRHFAWS
jgi:transposase